MSEAERIVEVTRRMHVIASSAEGATLTLSELERMAEQTLDVASCADGDPRRP
jgi:hypothetical protein